MLTNYKVYVNRLLCKLGLRDILPRSVISKIKEVENFDPLINISNDKTLFFTESLKLKREVLLRKKVYGLLKEASNYLPKNIYFKIYSAYRPVKEQKDSWNKRMHETRKENPNIKEESEIIRLAGIKLANPSEGGYGGHQVGAAIDITLCDKNGKDFNMGTNVAEHTKKTKTKNKYLSHEEKKNRKILENAMKKVGFKNYPAEWWHYCYGDKMWAAYSGKKECIYSLIKK